MGGLIKRFLWAAFALMLCGALPCGAAEEAARYARQRARLMEEIRADVSSTSRFIGFDEIDPKVMEAMNRVPRHRFVPVSYRGLAYANRPLPIGHGQTISQPYIVALMTHLLDVEPGDRVLEIGTGSGYQAALLAEMGIAVSSIEIIAPLAQSARARLGELGYPVEVKVGDGYFGLPEWEKHGPFDGIVVTAAADHVPPPLIAQLAPGGHMVIPVGEPHAVQQLVLIAKLPDGEVRSFQLLPVRFVPLTRK